MGRKGRANQAWVEHLFGLEPVSTSVHGLLLRGRGVTSKTTDTQRFTFDSSWEPRPHQRSGLEQTWLQLVLLWKFAITLSHLENDQCHVCLYAQQCFDLILNKLISWRLGGHGGDAGLIQTVIRPYSPQQKASEEASRCNHFTSIMPNFIYKTLFIRT